MVARFPPKVKLPLTKTLLLRVCAAAPAKIVVPLAIVREPRPSGPLFPLTSGTPAVVGELFAFRISEPAFSCTPPVNVLEPPRITEPAPFLMSLAVLPEPPMVFRILAPSSRLSGEAPLVVTVRFAPASSNVDVTEGVICRLSLTEVMFPPDNTKVPPATVAAVLPPVPLKVIEPSVLLPVASVSVPPPLIVTLLLDAMVPTVD